MALQARSSSAAGSRARTQRGLQKAAGLWGEDIRYGQKGKGSGSKGLAAWLALRALCPAPCALWAKAHAMATSHKLSTSEQTKRTAQSEQRATLIARSHLLSVVKSNFSLV